MEDFEALQRLVSLSGNGAAVAAVFLGWKIFQRWERRTDTTNRELRAIREVLIAINPAAANVFRDRDQAENGKDLQTDS